MTSNPIKPQGYNLKREEPFGQISATVIFVCPHCLELHSRREIFSIPNFSVVGYALDCGDVRVAMPWEKK